MDNQQESSVKELSWLAGIIDGEGTITLRYHERKNTTPIIKPVFTVVNTSPIIINEIVRILEKNNMPFWRTEYSKTDRWKAKSLIEIGGIKRLLKFLPLIEEYLVGKKENSFIVRNWCESRISKYGQFRNHKYYDRDDFNALIAVKKLHGHQDEIDYKKIERLLKSSETIRDTSKDEDIART